jgi:site-specific recombinase XerD
MNQLTAYSPTLPAAAAQNLATWTATARDALAENTQKAYRADSAAFADWCQAQSVSSLPASLETIIGFLKAESATGKAVATIRRRASSIARMHKAAGVANPCDTELVRLTLKGIARTRGTDQRQAAGLTERDALTIKARMGDTVKDARDLALVLAGRDLLARSSELVSLTVADLEAADDGMMVRMRRRKTSTETTTYYIGPEAGQAVTTWLQRAGITSGPVFQTLTKGGKATGNPLDTRDVRRILKAVAVTARLEHGAAISGHSLRVGMAQDLVAADLDLASVMQAGGWATPSMVARYTQKLTARRGAVARFYAR